MKIKDINIYEAVTSVEKIAKGAGAAEKGASASEKFAARQAKMKADASTAKSPNYKQQAPATPSKDVKYNAPQKYVPNADRPSMPYPADARPKFQPKDQRTPTSTVTGKETPRITEPPKVTQPKAQPKAQPKKDFRPPNVVTPKSTATGKEVPTTFDPKSSSLAADYIKAAEKEAGAAEKMAAAAEKTGGRTLTKKGAALTGGITALAGKELYDLYNKDKEGEDVKPVVVPTDPEKEKPYEPWEINFPASDTKPSDKPFVRPPPSTSTDYRPSHLGPGEEPAYNTYQQRDDYKFPVSDAPGFKRDEKPAIAPKTDPYANVDWEATAARERLKGSPGLERSLAAATGAGPGYSSEPVDQKELSKWYQRDGTGDNDKTLTSTDKELPPIEDRSRWSEKEPAAEKPAIDLTDKKYQRGTVGTRSPDEIEWDTKNPYRGGQYPGPGWQQKEKEQGEKNWENLKAIGSKLNPFNWFKEDLEQFNRIKSLADTTPKKEISESHVNQTDMRQMLELMYEASKMADIKGKKHTGSYGKHYDTDEEGEDKDSKKSEPAEKKGRGRPKKDSTVDAGKWKGADDAASHIIGGKAPKGKSNLPSKKHTLKDWIEHYENVIAESTLAEKAPKGWEGTVKAMKKHKDIDNPYALAHYMKGKGYKSHKKVDEEKFTVNGRQVSKDVYDTHMKAAGKQPSPDQVKEAKKAKKDYDGDGKIESGKDEYQGSRIAAAKKAGKLKEGINFSEMMRETQMSIEEMLMELQSHIEEYKATGHMSEALRDALDLHKYSKKDKIMGETPMMPQPVVEEPVAEGPFEWAAKQANEQGKDVFKFGGETHPVTVSEAEKKTMSRHAKGHEKYGKDGMAELARLGQEGASEKKMDAARAKHNKYSDDKVDEGTVTKSGPNDLTGTWSSDKPAKGKPDVPPPVPNDPVSAPEKGKKPVKENNMDKQFEGWANELDSLLNENITINTNTSSEGDDSVTVTATEGDAGELIALLRNAGMGGIFGGGQEQETSPYGAPMTSDSSDNGSIGMLSVDGPEVIDGGDSVLELIKKMAGISAAPQQSSGEDYADEVPVDNAGDSMHEPEGEEDHEGEEEEQTEKGSDEEDHDDEDNKEVDEAYGQADEGNEFTEKLSQTPPGEEFEIDGKKYKDTSSLEEGDDPMCNECGMTESACSCDHVEESFENEPNEAMRDIEFMTNFITGGLNRQKRDQTTLPHTSVKVTESKDVLYEWKKLSGIK